MVQTYGKGSAGSATIWVVSYDILIDGNAYFPVKICHPGAPYQ